MCTAIRDDKIRPLAGRSLDLEYSLDEKIVLTPRKYPLKYRHHGCDSSHLATLGIATVKGGTPLYYDAVNECGLSAFALNFPKYGVYGKPREGMKNIASFEVIPRILSICKTVGEARELLLDAVITDDTFSKELPATPLHWMVADKEECITVESTEEGLKIYDNPVGALTNSPPFPYHLTRLADHMGLSSVTPENKLSDYTPTVYSRGMGAIGLPGDFSSASRFIKAVFVKENTVPCGDAISRFFHIMDAVSVPLGCIITDSDNPVSTVYTSCADLDAVSYYYTTYASRQIHGVALEKSLLDTENIKIYPLSHKENIDFS